jgi:elongation factor P--beta-lysine ligase
MQNNHPFFIKEQLIKAIRRFFEEQQFHEVIVPVLNEALPVDPNIYAFKTAWHYADQTHERYLSTSPEAALKKALALGLEKVFAISPSFRDFDPAGNDHHPEFLMLEWYRAGTDYQTIMDEVEELIVEVNREVQSYLNNDLSLGDQLCYQGEWLSLKRPWKRVSLPTLFEQVAGAPFFEYQRLDKMQILAQKYNYQINNATWEQLFNQFFTDQLEPTLGAQPVFLTDLPSQISPCAVGKIDNPHLAERFELYLGGMELANGNTEETDSILIAKRFKQENAERLKNGESSYPVDQEFITALEAMSRTKQPYAGVGLGVERLGMLLADRTTLSF